MNERFKNLFTFYGNDEQGQNRAFALSTGDYGQRSSLGAILGILGLFIGAFSYADDGGLWPAFGGCVGCCIGFGIGKAITVGARLAVDGILKGFKYLVSLMRGGV